MATATLERQTEVVQDKAAATVSVVNVAAGERRATVRGDGWRAKGEPRAWNAKAQVD